MAYYIEYPGSHPKWKTIKYSWTIHSLSVVLILLVLISAFLPSSRKVWMDVMIPGDNVATQEAVGVLISEIQQGEKLDDAFFDFCGSMLYEYT